MWIKVGRDSSLCSVPAAADGDTAMPTKLSDLLQRLQALFYKKESAHKLREELRTVLNDDLLPLTHQIRQIGQSISPTFKL